MEALSSKMPRFFQSHIPPVVDKFHDQILLDIRVHDLNYGAHLGGIELQNLMHESRLRLFNKYGLSELNFGEGSLLLTEMWIKLFRSAFLGQILEFKIAVCSISKVRFELYYEISNVSTKEKTAVSVMEFVCVDSQGKPLQLPEVFCKAFL